MPLILGTNSIKDTGFDVANSARFDNNAYMSQTWGSSGNRRTWTLSMWIKYSGLNNCRLFSIGDDASNTILDFFFTSGDLRVQDTQSGSETLEFRTDQVFRDPSAWSHLVFACDTTQGTEGNRFKIYHNGTQITSFSTETYPSENLDTLMNHTSGSATIGARAVSQSGTEFDGYMAEVVVLDGTATTPTSFGEFDEDSGIWKPIDVSGLTFGTNGFYLDFEDSSNLGNDANGGTDLTEVNIAAIDQSTDTCINNFATLNPLALRNNPSAYYVTFSEGNLKVVGNDATNNGNGFSTMGFSSGKWYCEVKVLSVEGSLYPIIGVVTENSISNGSGNNGIIGQVTSDTVGYANDGEKVIAGTESSYGDTYTDNDIIGIAIDCDNGAVYFSKNGTFQASGNPTSGASKTNAAMTFTPSANYFFGVSAYKSTSDVEFNFGSPPYAISSGNTDGNGYGNFEYAVPANYYSLNSKNLSEFG